MDWKINKSEINNSHIQQIISDNEHIWEALHLFTGRSEMVRGGNFGCPSLGNYLLLGNPCCLVPKTLTSRSWASLGPAQGMLLAVSAVVLQKSSGKSLQKLRYLFNNNKKQTTKPLSLHLLCWLNPSGEETSAPAVAGWSLCWTAHMAITKHCELLKLNLLWDWNRADLQPWL